MIIYWVPEKYKFNSKLCYQYIFLFVHFLVTFRVDFDIVSFTLPWVCMCANVCVCEYVCGKWEPMGGSGVSFLVVQFFFCIFCVLFKRYSEFIPKGV